MTHKDFYKELKELGLEERSKGYNLIEISIKPCFDSQELPVHKLTMEDILVHFQSTAIEMGCPPEMANLGENIDPHAAKFGSISTGNDDRLKYLAIVDWAYTEASGQEAFKFTNLLIKKSCASIIT